MITLDKILTELKPGSLNEIVAGCGNPGKGKSGKNGHKQKSGRKGRSGSSSGKSGYTCGCTASLPPAKFFV